MTADTFKQYFYAHNFILDSLKLTVEAKPLGSSSFNETLSTNSAGSASKPTPGGSTSRAAKKNILDSLLAMDDGGGDADDFDFKLPDKSKPKADINLDASFEFKAGPAGGSARRSVRFSENLVRGN